MEKLEREDDLGVLQAAVRERLGELIAERNAPAVDLAAAEAVLHEPSASSHELLSELRRIDAMRCAGLPRTSCGRCSACST